MKTKFHIVPFILIMTTTLFMNYKLASVGVPDGIVIAISVAYVFLFPWKCVSVEEVKDEGDNSNETHE